MVLLTGLIVAHVVFVAAVVELDGDAELGLGNVYGTRACGLAEGLVGGTNGRAYL